MLLAHLSGLCPINAIASPLSPPHRLSPASSRGGVRRRLLVTLATVSGPRRPGNCSRPLVSLLLGPSGHPDNLDPFRLTISPFPVTLATVTRPTASPARPPHPAPATHHLHPAHRLPRPKSQLQAEVPGSPFLSSIFLAPEGNYSEEEQRRGGEMGGVWGPGSDQG